MKAELPALPGTYVLVLRCARTGSTQIGRLGRMAVCSGYFVYSGSAFGPGGLRARVGHHRRIAARPRWHIDYLRRHARLEAVWFRCGTRCEHEWAAAVAALPGAVLPLAGFGSSDCACPAHLYWFEDCPPLRAALGAVEVIEFGGGGGS